MEIEKRRIYPLVHCSVNQLFNFQYPHQNQRGWLDAWFTTQPGSVDASSGWLDVYTSYLAWLTGCKTDAGLWLSGYGRFPRFRRARLPRCAAERVNACAVAKTSERVVQVEQPNSRSVARIYSCYHPNRPISHELGQASGSLVMGNEPGSWEKGTNHALSVGLPWFPMLAPPPWFC